MEIKKAVRKTFEADYVIITEENMQEVAEWCKGEIVKNNGDTYINLKDKNAMNARQNKAFVGDRVLKVRNTFKSFTLNSFKKSFDDKEYSVKELSRMLNNGEGI